MVSLSPNNEDSPINLKLYHLATRRIWITITGACRGKETIWISTKIVLSMGGRINATIKKDMYNMLNVMQRPHKH